MLTPSGRIHWTSSDGFAHAKAGSRRSGAPRSIKNNNKDNNNNIIIISVVNNINICLSLSLSLVDFAGVASEASSSISAAAL